MSKGTVAQTPDCPKCGAGGLAVAGSHTLRFHPWGRSCSLEEQHHDDVWRTLSPREAKDAYRDLIGPHLHVTCWRCLYAWRMETL